LQPCRAGWLAMIVLLFTSFQSAVYRAHGCPDNCPLGKVGIIKFSENRLLKFRFRQQEEQRQNDNHPENLPQPNAMLT